MGTEQAVASKEEFEQTAHKILSSDKYWRFNNEVTQKADSLWDKFIKWLENITTKHHANGEQVAGVSDALNVVAVIVLCILLVIAMSLIIYYIYNCHTRRRKLNEILGEKITKETTPMTLRDTARSYEEKGNYRMSIRYNYIALLLRLHDRRVLNIENTMTNMEIYQELEKNQYPYLEDFKKIMETFDYVWYGQNETDQQHCSAYKEQVMKLWDEVKANGKS